MVEKYKAKTPFSMRKLEHNSRRLGLGSLLALGAAACSGPGEFRYQNIGTGIFKEGDRYAIVKYVQDSTTGTIKADTYGHLGITDSGICTGGVESPQGERKFYKCPEDLNNILERFAGLDKENISDLENLIVPQEMRGIIRHNTMIEPREGDDGRKKNENGRSYAPSTPTGPPSTPSNPPAPSTPSNPPADPPSTTNDGSSEGNPGFGSCVGSGANS